MKLKLEVKQPCNWFWLRGVKKARIDKCCVKCFTAIPYPEMYESTRYKEKANVSMEITPDPQVKAYYLCGVSRGFKYENNSHVVFVPCEGAILEVDTPQIYLTITDARQIHFQDYVPTPEGEYTEEQRKCRNWIFANYLLDGMPL